MKSAKMRPNFVKDILTTLFFVAAATIMGVLFHRWNVQEANVVVVYIFSVLLTARFTDGYLYGITASILSLLTFNWFFTEPLFTLKVNDPVYLITFFIMAITAIITSALTTKAKQATDEAREKEAESIALYRLTSHLTDAKTQTDIAEILVNSASELLDCCAACICYNEEGEPEHTFIQRKADGSLLRRELEEPEEFKQRLRTLHTPYDVNGVQVDWPIYGGGQILCVLRFPVQVLTEMDESQRRVLLAVLESTALAMERYRSLQEQAKSREAIQQERYRSNLLRAISHDIRTPLSGIMGTSEMLMDMTEKDDPRFKLEENVYQDAAWLHSLVENILSLTKIQDGRLALEKEPEVVEEVVGAAITVIGKRFPNREITVHTPDTLLMVPMDARLINQVLVNLLDNAAKHSRETDPIDLTVTEGENEVLFCVSDHGRGIPEAELSQVFQMFYTTRGKSPDSKRGVGLGLAICQTIVNAHGGKIHAQNRENGSGAQFIFSLPMEGGAE